jgi:hypothetical protein
MRSLTDIVSEGFIWDVGIIRPKERQRRFAVYYIFACLNFAILGAVGSFLFMVTWFSHALNVRPGCVGEALLHLGRTTSFGGYGHVDQ